MLLVSDQVAECHGTLYSTVLLLSALPASSLSSLGDRNIQSVGIIWNFLWHTDIDCLVFCLIPSIRMLSRTLVSVCMAEEALWQWRDQNTVTLKFLFWVSHSSEPIVLKVELKFSSSTICPYGDLFATFLPSHIALNSFCFNLYSLHWHFLNQRM